MTEDKKEVPIFATKEAAPSVTFCGSKGVAPETKKAICRMAQVVLQEKPRDLTPEELQTREKNKERLRSVGALKDQPAGAVADQVVLSSSNPDIAVYLEFRAGVISLEEMLTAIYSRILQDDAELQMFEYVRAPLKPVALCDAEADLYKKLDKSQIREGIPLLRDKLSEKDPEIKSYLISLKRSHSQNLSNCLWMKSVYDFFKTRNAVYASKALAVISTHEAPTGE